MKKGSISLRFVFFLFMVAMSVGGCNGGNKLMESFNMNALTPRLISIFDQAKSICFGRMLVEVPFSSVAIYGYAEVPWKIERVAEEGGKVEIWVGRSLEKIKNGDVYADETLKGSIDALYGKVIAGAAPNQKMVFGADKGAGIFYRIESFIGLGSDLFVQNAQARTSEQIKEDGGTGSVNDVIAELNDVALKIRSRADGEIPGEIGVCIDGAFIPKALGGFGENFALGIRLKEFPDVHFSISTRVTNGGSQEEAIDDMKRRQKDAERQALQSGYGAWYEGIKFLRRGEREFNGGKGYEILVRKPRQNNGMENHQFVFEGAGEIGSELKPAFSIQMDTGAGRQEAARVSPSLTDEEALALWDKFLSSIRVRPTTSSKASQFSKPNSPIGELHVTGHRCPQAGWWECNDDLKLAQASGIWLEKGQLMPKALVWVQPSFWDRIKGVRPVGWTPAVWRLAGYEKPAEPQGGAPGETQPG